MSRSPTRIALVALEMFVAVTAVGGGLALTLGLESGRFPNSWLTGTPFRDYTWPGIILAVIVGGSSAVAMMALVRRSRVGARATALAGCILVGWIACEILLVRADNELISPTEALYQLTGMAMVGFAIRLDRRPMKA